MIKTQILLPKIIEGNRRLRVRVRFRFFLFYFEIGPTDPWCSMLQTLLGRKKYAEQMSDEHPLTWVHKPKTIPSKGKFIKKASMYLF